MTNSPNHDLSPQPPERDLSTKGIPKTDRHQSASSNNAQDAHKRFSISFFPKNISKNA